MRSPTPPPPPPYAAKHTIIAAPPAVSNRTPATSPPSLVGKLPSLDPAGHRVSTALNITFSPTPSFASSSSSPARKSPSRPDTFGQVGGGGGFSVSAEVPRRHTVQRISSSSASIATPATASHGTAPPEWKPGVCSKCGARITNAASACQAMGCLYHDFCFVCCCCQRTLRGKTFYKDQDKIYCEDDYLYCGFQRMAEKCVACGHIIAQTILQAMGKSYHPGCFRCVICNKCMDGEPFTVDQSGQVYCLFDYYLVTAPTCAACANPILPVLVKRHFDPKPTEEVIRVVAMNKEFHVECYRCEDCDLLLSDETNSRCYPYTETAENGSPGRTHLLCLKCHLTRIGATPAPGQNVELQRRRGSNGSSSIASSSDLGGPGSSSPSRVYSPTPTSSGLALIGSAEGNAGSPGGVSSPAYKVTRPWGAGQGVPGRPSYLKNDGR